MRLHGGRVAVGVGRQEGDVVGRRLVARGRVLERVAHVALAHAGDVEVLRLDLLDVLGDDDDLAGTLFSGIAGAHLDAHLPGEVELRPVVLAGARVLRLLHDDGGVARQLAGEADGRGHGGVAGRAALQALELDQRLGDVEDLALGDREVAVDVAQRAGRVARHVGAVRPGGEGHAEAGVAGGEALAVEVVVAGHVQAGEVDRGAHDLRVGGAGALQAAGGARGVAAAGVRDDDGRRVGAGERASSRVTISRPRVSMPLTPNEL